MISFSGKVQVKPISIPWIVQFPCIPCFALHARKKNNPLHGNGFTLPFPENFIRNYYFYVVNLLSHICVAYSLLLCVIHIKGNWKRKVVKSNERKVKDIGIYTVYISSIHCNGNKVTISVSRGNRIIRG